MNKMEMPAKAFTAKLEQLLGQALSPRELADCIKNLTILQPNAGNLIWQSLDASVGIYLIVEGKARLLDDADNLIVSLTSGMSFGELTLFAQEDFKPYRVRASTNLTLAYLNGRLLQTLTSKYPAIQERLYRQAVERDLLLALHTDARQLNLSKPGLVKMVSLLERHPLIAGQSLAVELKNYHLLLLHQGELLHSSGQKLSPGQIYNLSQLPLNGTWQVTQPSDIYLLDRNRWQTLQTQLVRPELETDRTELLTTAERIGKRKIEEKSQKKPKKTEKAYFPRPNLKLSQWWQQLTHRYPFYRQQSDRDCGVACLVAVGRYWGKRFSINQLRDIANVDRNGASLQGLVTAAESIGFSAQPVKVSNIKSLAGVTRERSLAKKTLHRRL
jgi:CRP-like cAMP-binding protein